LNLDYHVRHTALPAPGSEEQLKTLAARFFSQALDRSKPLWELWLVEGLKGGRFAVVGKSHHCLVDGVSGMDITTVLFDVEKDPPEGQTPEPWVPRPAPSEAQLLAEALVERAVSPREGVRMARRLLRGPRRAVRKLSEGTIAAAAFARAGIAAPPTPFNVPIGPHRRFSWVRTSLNDLKRVKNAFGGTVNDVVLAVVAGGMGRYLRSRGHRTSELEMRAMVPVSVRTDDQHGDLGNKVSAMMAPLPVWCEDPEERMHLISESMGDLKESKQALGASLMTELTDFAPPSIAGSAARLQSRQRFFNVVVTNIPGPQFPLFLLGRRMERVFPMVPLAKNQALCVGVMSYDGQVNFGLIGDYDAMADLEGLGDDIAAELAAMVEAAGGRRGRLFRRERKPSPAPVNGNGNGSHTEESPAPRD
jgi:diacylglycerol O-acyltransferase